MNYAPCDEPTTTTKISTNAITARKLKRNL